MQPSGRLLTLPRQVQPLSLLECARWGADTGFFLLGLSGAGRVQGEAAPVTFCGPTLWTVTTSPEQIRA